MDAPTVYLQGFLIATALVAIEHAALYERLKPKGTPSDTWRVLTKFCLGVASILTGCAWVAYQAKDMRLFLSPFFCSLSGLVIAAAYLVRYLWEQGLAKAQETAYRRGRLHGMADHADIAEGEDGG